MPLSREGIKAGDPQSLADISGKFGRVSISFYFELLFIHSFASSILRFQNMSSLRNFVRAFLVSLPLICVLFASPQPSEQDWTHFVRIAAFGLQTKNVDEIVQRATDSNVSGIEVDNDITGRYDSFVDPTEKLNAIRVLAGKAHRAGNHAFVYIAGTECITPHGGKAEHTLAKDHPDWLQRDIKGAPAIFGSGDAFWIAKGDEDVWVSPYAVPWRQIYMERVRQIAATGIDGIYVDIPYWMTHFKGWDKTWASFDDYTVSAFKQKTGLDARKDLKLGDFSDANFRKWVDFRLQTIVDFLRDIDQNAKSVNPQIKTIPEIYPGIEEEVVRVGSDPYRLYPVVDAIAHEYEFGEGDHTAAARTPLDWFQYQAGMASFRAFAEGKATWMLNYSWDSNQGVDPREAMQMLAMSEIMIGSNVWDASGHVMSGSNDLPTRKKVFEWIRQHEAVFYHPRTPIHPVGVYFSPATRDYFVDQFVPCYQGSLILLMQAHLEYQIVTPRTLGDFKGQTLVLPNVLLLDVQERSALKSFLAKGGRLVVTGANVTGFADNSQIVRLPDCSGKGYLDDLRKNFAGTNPSLEEDFLHSLVADRGIDIQASPAVASNIALVDDQPHIFLANFGGLVSNKKASPTLEVGARIILKGKPQAHFLPFLGEVEELRGVTKDGETTYVLPNIAEGAVVWFGAPHASKN